MIKMLKMLKKIKMLKMLKIKKSSQEPTLRPRQPPIVRSEPNTNVTVVQVAFSPLYSCIVILIQLYSDCHCLVV